MLDNQINLCFFMDFGIMLCFTGMCGLFLNRRNIIISLICIELVLFGINFYLVTLSLYLDDITSQIMSLFVLAVAAGESAVALALVTSFFRCFHDISLKEIS